MAEDWVVLEEVAGMFQAEILRGLLEAQEIPTVLSQEGAGKAIGLTIGTLGAVQILVPLKDLDRAQEALEAYNAGSDEEQPPL
jgi:hypothetical protein